MSNVEARVSHTFSPPSDGPFEVGEGAFRKGYSAQGLRRRLLVAGLLAGDTVSTVLAILAADLIVNLATGVGHVGMTNRLEARLPETIAMLIGIRGLLGAYRSSSRSLIERFRQRATATLLFVFTGMLMSAREGFSTELATTPLVGAIAFVLGSWTDRLLGAWLGRFHLWGAPTVILGTGAASRRFARLLMRHPVWGLNPIGFIEDEARNGGNADGGAVGQDTVRQDNEDPAAALPLLGTLAGWRAGSSDVVVVVPDGRDLPRDPASLHRLGAGQILVASQLGELASFDLQVRHLDGFVALELGGRPRSPGDGLKRAIDLAVALPLALVAGPIIGLLALGIKIVDPGSAFYSQRRVGRYGKPINVLKLRTMYQDAEQRLEHVLATDVAKREQWQRFFKLAQDPRILPYVGNFLRRTSLDEVPQLWNVIRGDMSLVGPRPFPAYHMEALDAEFRELRVTVPPGLSGLWQVSSRSNGDIDAQRSEDCSYIRNRSLWLDLYILIATLPAVIGGRGAK